MEKENILMSLLKKLKEILKGLIQCIKGILRGLIQCIKGILREFKKMIKEICSSKVKIRNMIAFELFVLVVSFLIQNNIIAEKNIAGSEILVLVVYIIILGRTLILGYRNQITENEKFINSILIYVLMYASILHYVY